MLHFAPSRGSFQRRDPHARGVVPWMQKLRIPLVGVEGYQRFPLDKPVLGQNIALRERLRTGRFCLLRFCFPGSFNFIFPKLSSEPDFLTCGMDYILFRPDMTLRG